MNKKLYKLMNWPEIEGVVYSECDHPHDLLGAHPVTGGIVVQTFQPGSKKVWLKDIAEDEEFPMEMVDEAGYFAFFLPKKTLKKYSFIVEEEKGVKKEVFDPYEFPPTITSKDTERFAKGIHYEIYRYLGAHVTSMNGMLGVAFAVWSPNAMRVSVVGDFNHWDGRVHQMRRLWESGIFELFIPQVEVGENYKFEIKLKGGLTYLKSDPYAFAAQLRPETASVVTEIDGFRWTDDAWMKARESRHFDSEPMNVYELHLGSFRIPEDGREFYNYRELAPMVASYVKEMGYTHIELMPIMEHPFDESWGYQIIGYYAPTSRYGTPEDFMFFMNEMHHAGIGVILDWVPAHFPRDVYGLSNFDGTALYEHLDPRQGAHAHWGTLIFNYGRPQVSNYLIANALFWIKEYHVDGIRMDAVASMLYLDYGKEDGQWVANMYGGNENLEALEFIKHLNSIVKKNHKGVLTIAEESTAWPKITGKLEEEGLGFDYKWNMGWMNDYLKYIQYDPYFRGYHHNELTFSMIYTYCEKFMLVFSHDEVVHGKGSMMGKMPGDIPVKYSNLRLTYAYMMMHPGKKLLFMGQDIADYEEWSLKKGVPWELLQYEEHKQLNEFVKTLNRFYKSQPALYEQELQPEGFEWINCLLANENMLVFLRKGYKEEETLLVVANFANVARDSFKVGVPFDGKYKEIFNSDAKEFGGTNVVNKKAKECKEEKWDGRPYSLAIHVAPLSVQVFSYVPFTKEELDEKKKKQEEKEKRAKEEAKRKEKLEKEKAKIKASLKEELAKKIAKAEEKIAAGSERKSDQKK